VPKIVLPLIPIVIGIISLVLGIILGSLLGKAGSLEVLGFIIRIPAILIKSPKKLSSKWRMWRELRGLKKVARLNIQEKVKGFKEKINSHKKEIGEIKAQIRRVKWEFRRPK